MPQRKNLGRVGKTGIGGRNAGREVVMRFLSETHYPLVELLRVTSATGARGSRNANVRRARGSPGVRRRRLRALEAGFFDLVEQRLVAHAEQLRRLAPVP